MKNVLFEYEPITAIIKRHCVAPLDSSIRLLPDSTTIPTLNEATVALDPQSGWLREPSSDLTELLVIKRVFDASGQEITGDLVESLAVPERHFCEKVQSKIQSQMEAHDLIMETLMLKLSPKFGEGLSRDVLSELTKSDLFLEMMETITETNRHKIYSAYSHAKATNCARRF